jgi:hypothetical protein
MKLTRVAERAYFSNYEVHPTTGIRYPHCVEAGGGSVIHDGDVKEHT